MFNNYPKLSMLLGACSSFFMHSLAFASVSVVFTAPPPLREIVVEPAGFSRCYVMPQGFYNGAWHYRHRVCEYDNGPNMRLWVSGYWQCVNYLPHGRCLRNAWIPSHWAGARDREYQITRGVPRGRQGFEQHGRYAGSRVVVPVDVAREPRGHYGQQPSQGHYGQSHGHIVEHPMAGHR